jgi:hypothetical protein
LNEPLSLFLSPLRVEAGVWTFRTNQPEGLPDGSRWSFRAKRENDHRRPASNGPHPGRGARLLSSDAARDWRCPRELSWHTSAMGFTSVRAAGRAAQSEGLGCRQEVAAARSPSSGTPPGCSTIQRAFPVVVPPFALNDHRLPSTNPAGWPPPVSSAENVHTPVSPFHGERAKLAHVRTNSPHSAWLAKGAAVPSPHAVGRWPRRRVPLCCTNTA